MIKPRLGLSTPLERLRQRNVQAREPLVRHLEGKLWELREESGTNIYRIIYFFFSAGGLCCCMAFRKRDGALPGGRLKRRIDECKPLCCEKEMNSKMTTEIKRDYIAEGQQAYQEWRDQFLADPEKRRIYEEEAAKKDLWLQLVEARQAAGLTQEQMAQRLGVSQAQVSRIEKRGYDAYTLNSLRKYVQALGEGFSLEVKVAKRPERKEQVQAAPVHN